MPDLVDLIILGPKSTAARCRPLGGGDAVNLRVGSAWTLVPGEIATVQVSKRWRYGRTDYVAGEIVDTRFDIAALDLTPLALRDPDQWDPSSLYEDLEPKRMEQLAAAQPWLQRVLAAGPRPSAEMEQIIPGVEPDAFDLDPICDAAEVARAGHPVQACTMLGPLLALDLRCLDAHAHLGTFKFDLMPKRALRHYEVGIAIGELSLTDHDLVLPWTLVDNRPLLRCLEGYGLLLWKEGRADEAKAVLERLLWINPHDEQGARVGLAEIETGRPWRA